MILEGIVTTVNADGTPNIAPMGPRVDRAVTTLTLRPFRTSTTCTNLLRTRQGVLHVTDDVRLLARAAVDRLADPPPLVPARAVDGWVLADACRWFEFRVTSVDESSERTSMECAIVERGRGRDFFGFNRAMHAVLEAAILATRLHLLPREQVLSDMTRLRTIVDKTAGDDERDAFAFLDAFVAESFDRGA